MIRNQLLLTEDLNDEVESFAKKLEISKSEAVRQLLRNSLNTKPSDDNSEQKFKAFISTLDSFNEDNPRINGFKELYSVGANITKIFVINDSLFRYYFEHKKLPQSVVRDIEEIAQDLVKSSYTGKLVVRRAYVVPGLENPPGPRYLGLDVKDVADAVIGLYKFAIENDYYKDEKSKVAAFVYPFADPEPLDDPVPSDAVLPYGGYAVPLNTEASRVEVLAVWGNNEGVQSFDSVDRYVVDIERMTIVEKNIPQKSVMLATTKESQSEKLNVPITAQFKQVLTDFEILEVAKVVNGLTEKYGLRRVEFSFDGKSGIEFNESIAYEICGNGYHELDQIGKVRVIEANTDLTGFSELDAKTTILYIHKDIVTERAYDVLNNVAGLQKKFTVLYPGLSATAHAMRVLADFGHIAITVGNRIFHESEQINIHIDDMGVIDISRVGEAKNRKYIMNLYDAKLFKRSLVGGKAFNLSLLKSGGINVPHGYVLTTNFFDAVLIENLGKERYEKLFESKDGLEELLEVMQKEKLQISDKLWSETIGDIFADADKKYAVRSSATVEDHAEHAFAGQFKSLLKINVGDDLKAAVEDVINSTFSENVFKYFSALGQEWNTKMAVVVQEMVDAELSGVSFSKNLVTGDNDKIVIDIANGLAEGIVDGAAESQRVMYSKSRGDFVSKDLSGFTVDIDDDMLKTLVEMAMRLEQLMDGDQDIEWSIDKENRIWVLQSRDI